MILDADPSFFFIFEMGRHRYWTAAQSKLRKNVKFSAIVNDIETLIMTTSKNGKPGRAPALPRNETPAISVSSEGFIKLVTNRSRKEKGETPKVAQKTSTCFSTTKTD